MFTSSVFELPFLDKFGPKNQSCQFKLKLGAQNNSNIQHSKVMFLLFLFLTRKAILRKFCPNQNFQFKLEFVTKDNSNRQNAMAVFTFSLKYPY